MKRIALPLMLAFALLPTGADAQSPKVEATYVVLGPRGPVARAILTGATSCPAATIDGTQQTMSVRARPDDAFPLLVCELLISSRATSASLAGLPLPLPKTTLTSIAAFGDTGCRLKAAKPKGKGNDPDDDEDGGKFQDCNDPSLWPFARVAASVAAAQPDLVIHVGDYLYRESPCPAGDQGCQGSPFRDIWDTWKADFFAPAAPALRAAPWIVVRGNHEICKRAGTGYFRLLDPAPAQAAPPCIDLIGQFTATVADQSFIVLDSSNADDKCACDTGAYARQFAAMRPSPGTWLVTHRPIWGFRSHHKTINATLQQALARWDGKLPDGVELALAGHIHVAEVLSFADQRSPQLVLGTGGTLLAGKIDSDLTGKKIGGTKVSYGRADHRFGFALIERKADGGSKWKATFLDTESKSLFDCKIRTGRVTCE
jgi:hypothetical protein